MNHTIQVFEWEVLRVDDRRFLGKHFEALVQWQDRQEEQYFQVGHRKITFTQWVGVIQVGSLVIEVLPKADPSHGAESREDRQASVHRWKGVLVDMLRKTGRLRLRTTDDTDLAVRKQSLFDLYFQDFLDETEQLIHRGLVKKYRRKSRNRTALKGKLLFQKQLACNVVHRERFFTEAACYDAHNDWNEILLAALRVTVRSVRSGLLCARAKNLALHFPDWPERFFVSHDFKRLCYDRKTGGYERAVSLARLILLQLNPQIASGQEKVVAILFDMNRLWEDWLLACYRSRYQEDPHIKVLGKRRELVWAADNGNRKTVETDILIQVGQRMVILDAKWKRPKTLPSDDEIRQMLAYNLTWKSQDAWLVYPRVNGEQTLNGRFHYTTAGRLGMAYIEILKDGKLRTRLELPNLSQD